ncbi:hypothetical protein PHMEG_00016538 [Phytophthora megakarya]|uniref:Uncharacterized protein n=1 Tax=Phytophthora megakarya TaxID=4795 RepID=A0A225VYK5_9STRA|nr:hypothetical protein PHMEG_00016538 [Phytophthora megakarya]
MSIVEDPGLIEVVRFANNTITQLSMPSRQNTVADGSHAKYCQYRLSLRLRRADVDECYFSLSSDIWTSLKRESFIGQTLHQPLIIIRGRFK